MKIEGYYSLMEFLVSFPTLQWSNSQLSQWNNPDQLFSDPTRHPVSKFSLLCSSYGNQERKYETVANLLLLNGMLQFAPGEPDQRNNPSGNWWHCHSGVSVSFEADSGVWHLRYEFFFNSLHCRFCPSITVSWKIICLGGLSSRTSEIWADWGDCKFTKEKALAKDQCNGSMKPIA